MRKIKNRLHSTLSIERTTKSCREGPLWLRLKRKRLVKNFKKANSTWINLSVLRMKKLC